MLLAAQAHAQRAADNALRSAEDAFGASVGKESIGLYSPDDVRGFSAVTAGNLRIDGLYFDQQEALSAHLVGGQIMRVGLAAQGFAFPAPTGVVDYQLRRPTGARALSVIAGGTSWGGWSLDIDAQTPLTATLSLGVGGGVYRDVFADRTSADYRQVAVIARWCPRPGIDVTPFFEAMPLLGNPATAIYVTRDGAPPVSHLPIAYRGPVWDAYRGDNSNAGVVASAGLWRDATLRAGVFRSSGTTRTTFAELFTDLTPQGLADRTIIADPPLSYLSQSAEIRLAQGLAEGPRRHLLLLSLRGRTVESRYGGSAGVDFGVGPIDPPPPIAEPAFVLGQTTRDSVRQGFAGLSYGLDWRGLGALTVGIQKTRYVKTVTAPGAPAVRVADAPVLWNAALAVTLTPTLTAYASHTTGLEEAGQAPDAAVNRTALTSAIRTRQTDAGLRWKPASGLSLIAGAFEVRKPYDAIDAAGSFRRLGDIDNRGVEVSLAGSPAWGWTVVAGAVLLDAAASGEAVSSGAIGRRPVGSTPAKAQAYAEYAPPAAPAWSFDLGVNWRDRVVASLDNRFRLPPRATVDLGLRYRFKVRGGASVLRLQLTNVAGQGGFVVLGPGAYKRADDRKGLIALATDF